MIRRDIIWNNDFSSVFLYLISNFLFILLDLIWLKNFKFTFRADVKTAIESRGILKAGNGKIIGHNEVEKPSSVRDVAAKMFGEIGEPKEKKEAGANLYIQGMFLGILIIIKDFYNKLHLKFTDSIFRCKR